MFSPNLNLIVIGRKVEAKALIKQTAQKERMTIFGHFDEFIKSKEQSVSWATLVVYNIVKGIVNARRLEQIILDISLVE